MAIRFPFIRYLLPALLVLSNGSCIQVEEIIPLYYPAGEIRPIADEEPPFEELPVPDIVSAVPGTRTPIHPEDIRNALISRGIDPDSLSDGEYVMLAEQEFCFQPDEVLAGYTSYYAAYAHLLAGDWPIWLSSDFIADRFFTMYFALLNHIERHIVIPQLAVLLQELTHTALDQYLHSFGDLKETAWRNTAFLCIAHRLLEQNAPTPFVVSGVVRRELDLIQAAEGEAASPLFALDAKGNPCLQPYEPGCIDYTMFELAADDADQTDHRRLRQCLLWLSRISFPLPEKYTFLQTILLTDCVKRTQIESGRQMLPAWRQWLSIVRFYAFIQQVDTQDYTFPDVDAILRDSFPQSFDENMLLDAEQLALLEQDSSWRRFRAGEFRFFPLHITAARSYLRALVFPATGPDTSSPLYHDLLLENLSADCVPSSDYVYRRSALENCRQMTEPDFRFLYCNMKNLSYEHREVLTLFRTLPQAPDFLRVAGWPPTTSDGNDAYCRFRVNLQQQRVELDARSPRDWMRSLPDATIFMIRQLNPERYPPFLYKPVPAWHDRLTLNALNMLPHLQRSYPRRTEPPFSGPDDLQQSDLFLEPSPTLYNRLRLTTDYLRKKLMMLGYSSMELDDILIRYIDIADQLKTISLTLLADEERSADRLFVQALLERFIFTEKQLSLYLEGESGFLPDMGFPRTTRLWDSPITGNQLFLVSGNFHRLLVCLRREGELRVASAPMPMVYELESSADQQLQNPEIRELIEKGILRPLVTLDPPEPDQPES
ncbi:MAG: DUF3160 domain-containing protein [Acidobacteria bacterium]|nr:DUF3160 domain-containing protein [Acidobacteriota bacterium]